MNKNYTLYTALDFAQDDAFIKWVRQSDQEATAFWEAWLAAHPEKEAEIAEARQLVQSIKIEEPQENVSQVDRMWQKIETGIQEESPQQIQPQPRSITRWMGYAAAAASVLLLVFFLFPRTESTQELLAQNGEMKAYYLPDSSMVELNAGSRLVVDMEHWLEERKVKLDGEAFFKVRKGSRFVVETNNGMVEVLGTSFNVNTRAGGLKVDCFTGKVQVSKASMSGAEVLRPLEGVRLEPGSSKWDRYKVSPSRQATWRDGMFYFEESPLINVFAELERQFDIQIDLEEKDYMNKYSGFFEGRDIDKALKSVCYPMSLDYEKNGGIVTIRSEDK